MSSRESEEVKVVIRGEETVSSSFDDVMRGAQAMQRSVRTSSKGIERSMDGVERSADEMGRGISQASRKFDFLARSARKAENAILSYNQKMQGLNRMMAQGALGLGRTALYGGAFGYAGLGAFGVSSVGKSTSFAQQFGYTRGAIRSNYATEEAFEADSLKLKRQAKVLGADSNNIYSSTEIAAAQEALAKAGLADDTGIDKVLAATPKILSFATANSDIGNLDLASTIASDISSMFGIDPKDWDKMLDQLTKAADISTIDVTDLYETLKYTGPMAQGLGNSFEDVLALSAVLGNKGIKGSMAGTGIQSYYARLLNPNDVEKAPSTRASRVYKEFTSNVVRDGQAVSTVEQIELLQKAFSQLNQQEMSWMAKQLFGLEQMKAGFALASAGADEVNKSIQDIEKNAIGMNKMKEALALDNEYGDLVALRKAFNSLQEQIGDGLSPVVSEVAKQLTSFLNGEGMDLNKLYESFELAGEKLKELNPELAETVEFLGKLGVGTMQVGGSVMPIGEGLVTGIAKGVTGSPIEGVKAILQGFAESADKIKDLPEDLQLFAEGLRNVAMILAAMGAINLTAKGLETVGKGKKVGKTIWEILFGKKDPKLGGLGDDMMDDLSNTVSVYGNVVNVYGAGGKGPGGGVPGVPVPGSNKPSTPKPTNVPKPVPSPNTLQKGAEWVKDSWKWARRQGLIKVLFQGSKALMSDPILGPATGFQMGYSQAKKWEEEANSIRQGSGADVWLNHINKGIRLPNGIDPYSQEGSQILQNYHQEMTAVADMLTSVHQQLKTDKQKDELLKLSNQLYANAIANMYNGEEHIFKGVDFTQLADFINKVGTKDILSGKSIGSNLSIEQETQMLKTMAQINKAISEGSSIKVSQDPSTIRVLVEMVGDNPNIRVVNQQYDIGKLEVQVNRKSRRYGAQILE